MEKADRRVRRTRKSLHDALISLILEKNYDAITVQEILDRADVGRSTFYSHFQSKDELLISGVHDLRRMLNSKLQGKKAPTKGHEDVIAFSGAMFEHANEYRNVYYAILNTQAWPLIRQHIEEVLDELIRRECKAEIGKLKKTDPDLPVDLFVHYLTGSFFSVLMWWANRRSRLTPSEINKVFRSLVLPTINTVLG